MKKLFPLIKNHYIEITLIIFTLSFSFWLMFKTFSYSDDSMLIAVKAWSDFGSHIPLIRSFSFGSNLPIEYPIFPGEPIKYHFLFYFLVGMLEKIGIRIDYALNIPSAFSFFLLLLSVYFLAKLLFKSKIVGILAVVFLLFNSSFSFLEFFKTHSFSFQIISQIVQNNTFPSFGPYDGKIVSAFWNLNIYTNQRHLAIGAAFLVLFVWFVYKYSRLDKQINRLLILLWILLVGALPYIHFGIFIMLYHISSILFILLPRARLIIFAILFYGGILALPSIFHLQSGASTSNIGLYFGFLSSDKTLYGITYYWFMNLGLSLILIPLGFLFSPKDAKKLFIAILPLFLIGNLVKFSPEIAANHKFFTIFIIFGNIFSAYALYRLWKIHFLGKFLFIPLFVIMILSGIIDFFPIKNDLYMKVVDYPKNEDTKWIVENTPKDALFLNASYFNNPASIAGRKIFLGWPYFPWSLGYDTYKRDALRKSLFGQDNLAYVCSIIREYDIDYIHTENRTGDDEFINHDFFERNFQKVYNNKETLFSIYSVKPTC